MFIKTFTVGPFEVNNYLIACPETKKAAMIDFGDFDISLLQNSLKANNFELQYVLLTHGHLDHISATRELQMLFNIPVYVHKEDKFLVDSLENQLLMFGFEPLSPPEKLNTIDDSVIIDLGRIKIKIIHTPGHSPGSVCYYIEQENVLFSGDTIFAGSIGRTDLIGGSYEILMNSIDSKLKVLPDTIKVYSGHGQPTSIGEEKLNNPFFGINASNIGKY